MVVVSLLGDVGGAESSSSLIGSKVGISFVFLYITVIEFLCCQGKNLTTEWYLSITQIDFCAVVNVLSDSLPEYFCAFNNPAVQFTWFVALDCRG